MEKACRGDDQRTFPWGNAPLEQATASDRSSNVLEQFLPRQPSAVLRRRRVRMACTI